MNYDSLFALKLYYEDVYEDEYDIIRMLKIQLLLNQNIQENEVNIKLKEFYDSFGTNIDLEVFENIKITRNNNDEDTSSDEDNNEQDNDENINIPPLLNEIFNAMIGIVMPMNDMITHTEDVISTINEEDINKLKKYTLENNLDDKCLICIDNMETGQEVTELPCIHKYHSNCINEYLTKYNYKCPCCKEEVGKPVHNV